MDVGDKVLITDNPHDSQAHNVVGTIKGLMLGEGFGGSDLAEVSFYSPRAGKVVLMPIGTRVLDVLTVRSCLDYAKRLQNKAHKMILAALELVKSQ